MEGLQGRILPWTFQVLGAEGVSWFVAAYLQSLLLALYYVCLYVRYPSAFFL